MYSMSCRYPKRSVTVKRKQTLVLIFLIGMVGFLYGCDSSTPSPPPSVLSVRLEGGVAWLGDRQHGTQLEHQKPIEMYWNQTIWTGEDEAATLLIGEEDQLWLNPNSGFRLVSSIQSNQRPVLRLLQGRLRYRTVGNHYALGTHIEVPFELRMLVADLVVTSVLAETELDIVIEDDVTTMIVLSGEVTALGNGVSETLFTDWRVIVRPGEPMQVIPPVLPDTPTPTATPTPTSTSTLTMTPTPLASATPTLSATLTSSPTATATSTSTSTLTPFPTLLPALPTYTPTPTEAPPPPPPPPTAKPPTAVPPTAVPTTAVPPTPVPTTAVPPTLEPLPTTRPTPGPGG